MSNIVYIATSLDGYISALDGKLDWLSYVPIPEGDDLGFAFRIRVVEGKAHETLSGARLQILQDTLVPRVVGDDQQKVGMRRDELTGFFDGQQATMINPIATGLEKLKSFAIPKASAGMMRYWERKPTMAGFG